MINPYGLISQLHKLPARSLLFISPVVPTLFPPLDYFEINFGEFINTQCN